MAVVQPFFDPVSIVAPSFFVSYMNTFMKGRSEQQQQMMNEALRAMSQDDLNKQLDLIKQNIKLLQDQKQDIFDIERRKLEMQGKLAYVGINKSQREQIAEQKRKQKGKKAAFDADQKATDKKDEILSTDVFNKIVDQYAALSGQTNIKEATNPTELRARVNRFHTVSDAEKQKIFRQAAKDVMGAKLDKTGLTADEVADALMKHHGFFVDTEDQSSALKDKLKRNYAKQATVGTYTAPTKKVTPGYSPDMTEAEKVMAGYEALQSEAEAENLQIDIKIQEQMDRLKELQDAYMEQLGDASTISGYMEKQYGVTGGLQGMLKEKRAPRPMPSPSLPNLDLELMKFGNIDMPDFGSRDRMDATSEELITAIESTSKDIPQKKKAKTTKQEDIVSEELDKQLQEMGVIRLSPEPDYQQGDGTGGIDVQGKDKMIEMDDMVDTRQEPASVKAARKKEQKEDEIIARLSPSKSPKPQGLTSKSILEIAKKMNVVDDKTQKVDQKNIADIQKKISANLENQKQNLTEMERILAQNLIDQAASGKLTYMDDDSGEYIQLDISEPIKQKRFEQQGSGINVKFEPKR